MRASLGDRIVSTPARPSSGSLNRGLDWRVTWIRNLTMAKRVIVGSGRDMSHAHRGCNIRPTGAADRIGQLEQYSKSPCPTLDRMGQFDAVRRYSSFSMEG